MKKMVLVERELAVCDICGDSSDTRYGANNSYGDGLDVCDGCDEILRNGAHKIVASILAGRTSWSDEERGLREWLGAVVDK